MIMIHGRFCFNIDYVCDAIFENGEVMVINTLFRGKDEEYGRPWP